MRLQYFSYVAAFFFSFNPSLAQQLPYTPSPFSGIGRIQAATVTNVSDVLSGGTLRVNDITMVVPKNLLVTLPSITVSWSELFNADGSLNLPNFEYGWEASVYANRLAGGQYVAGMIYVFQNFLQTSSGFITAIDYSTGELRIGGDLADPTSGVRVIINDPVGRFGLVHDEWPLFTADTDNPSIRASTGFPVCIPRTNPATADDPLCPKKNRPLDNSGKPLSIFEFPAAPTASQPNPNFFVPLMVGDYVGYEATNVGGGLWSAYSIDANLGIYTAPGTAPVYMTIDVAQWGIVGSPAGEVAETRIQGYTTDHTQHIEVFAIDVDPCTGVETERVLGVVVPRVDGRRGHFRYRPDADITPATREVGARVQAGTGINGNGITTGQFIQPVMDDGFIFPELDIYGRPEIVYEFNLLQHLAQGSGQWLGGIPGQEPNPNGPVVGQLDPWPGAVAPPKANCPVGPPPTFPLANAGVDQSVGAGTLVTLSGRSDTSNIPENTITYLWTQVSGSPTVALTGGNTKTATFIGPTIAEGTTLTFKLTTSNTIGTTTDEVVVKVTGPNAGPDTITIISWDASNSKGTGQLNVKARSTVLDGSTKLTVEAVDPNVRATPMIYSGLNDGVFTILINTKKPDSFTVRSSRGASVTIRV